MGAIAACVAKGTVGSPTPGSGPVAIGNAASSNRSTPGFGSAVLKKVVRTHALLPSVSRLMFCIDARLLVASSERLHMLWISFDCVALCIIRLFPQASLGHAGAVVSAVLPFLTADPQLHARWVWAAGAADRRVHTW